MQDTTARTLGQYRKELLKQRISPEVIDDLVRHAGMAIHDGNGGPTVATKAVK